MGPLPTPEEDPNRDTLEARAAIDLAPWKLEREFFLNYDCWCDWRFARHLHGPKDRLSAKAKAFFKIEPPPPKPLPHLPYQELLRCGYRILPELPRDRAREAAAGGAYGVPLKVTGDDRMVLGNHGLDARTLIDGLAKLQFALFDAHYEQVDELRPSRELQLAFARFADGQLRIVQGDTAQLNAEPDSAYFFVFAEFSIQAAHFAAAPSTDWWRRLAALFARLNGVYCRRYPPAEGLKTFASYSAANFDAAPPHLTDDQLAALIDEVEEEDPTLETIVARVTESAMQAFAREMG